MLHKRLTADRGKGTRRSSGGLALATVVVAIGWATSARANGALEPCANLGNAAACASSDVGKTCPNNEGVCAALTCDDDGGATTLYLCALTDEVVQPKNGCSCGIGGRDATPLGNSLALAFAGVVLLTRGGRRRR
jgi:hypothetical protein